MKIRIRVSGSAPLTLHKHSNLPRDARSAHVENGTVTFNLKLQGEPEPEATWIIHPCCLDNLKSQPLEIA